MLIDLWGETSLYHTVVEALFGISMTFIAHFGRHDACTAASGRDCRVLVLRGDPKRAPAYVQEMATSLFGDGLLRADQVPALRQATVLVGSLIDAYRPVRWPRIYLHQLRYRASLQHAYAAFANLLHGAWRNGTDAPEVGHDAARGVWIRRDRSQPGLHFDRRHLLSDEIAALETALTGVLSSRDELVASLLKAVDAAPWVAQCVRASRRARARARQRAKEGPPPRAARVPPSG